MKLASAFDTTDAARLDRLGRGIGASLVGSVVTSAVGFALVILATRGLGDAAAGALFQTVAVLNIAVMTAMLGADVGLVHQISVARAQGRAGEVHVLLFVAFVPVAAVGAVFGAGIYIAAEPLANLLGFEPDPLRVAAPLIPISALSLVVLAATRGFATMTPTVRLERIGRPLGQLALLIVIVGLGAGVTAATAAWVMPYLATLMAGSIALTRLLEPTRTRARARDVWRRFWRYSVPLAGAGALRVMIRWIDTLIVGALLGVVAAAIYTASTRLLRLGSFANQAVFQAVSPEVSAALAQGDREAAEGTFQISTAWLVLATWPLYMTALLFAEPIVGIFGDGFGPGAGALRILAIAMLISSACGPVEAVLSMSGRSKLVLFDNSMALGANVFLNLVLIPVWGLNGAAVAWLVSMMLTNVLPLWQVSETVRIHPFGKPTVRSIVIAGHGFASAAAVAYIVAEPTLLTAGLSAVAGAAVLGVYAILDRESLRLDVLVRR